MSSSARLSIVEKALEEIISRLRDAEPSEEEQKLVTRACELDLEVAAWRGQPPTEARRRELVGAVMDLAVEAMRAASRR